MGKELKEVQDVEQETVDTPESAEEPKTLTQDEVNRLIAQNKSKAKEEARKELEKEMREQIEAEVEEAKRLAKLNDEERREEEFKKLQQEIEELKRKDAYHGLAREASKMLSEHSIQATDGILQFVVRQSKNIRAFNKKWNSSLRLKFRPVCFIHPIKFKKGYYLGFKKWVSRC